jgi:hypothetical protein
MIVEGRDCEVAVVTKSNIMAVREIWPHAGELDVLITGLCYQQELLKKE